MSGWVALLRTDEAVIEPSLVEDLTCELAYRGPEAQATWRGSHVALGHALFRTTDEAAHERQPATLDGRVHLVADARIDGRDDLRARLALPSTWDLGTTPDSEWILRAYARWGGDLCEHLLGDYSFALWDAPRRELFCATDPFGLRAVHYAHAGAWIVVSNSLSCLRRHPAVSSRLNDTAVLDFLVLGDHRWADPSLTMFEDVARLPPGHALVVRDGRLEVRRVWQFPVDVPAVRDRRHAAVQERFLHTLRHAVRDRLRTARLTVSMSGGLDSSCVAAVATDLVRRGEATTCIEAVTWTYDHLPLTRERSHAASVARWLEIPIHFLSADAYPFLDPPVPTTYPLEFYAPALIRDACRLEAARGPAVLVGAAGDNLLTPTPPFHSSARLNPWALVRASILHRRRYGALPKLGTGARALWKRACVATAPPYPFPAWLRPEWNRASALEERWHACLAWRPSPENARHPRLHAALAGPPWNVEDQFRRPGFVEPEVRDPYLDVRLLRQVLALDPLPWLPRKHILRASARALLPRAILERPKEALGLQHTALLGGPRATWVDRWEPHEDLEPYVRRSAIPALAGGRTNPAESYVALRPLLLDLWLRHGR